MIKISVNTVDEIDKVVKRWFNIKILIFKAKLFIMISSFRL